LLLYRIIPYSEAAFAKTTANANGSDKTLKSLQPPSIWCYVPSMVSVTDRVEALACGRPPSTVANPPRATTWNKTVE